MKTSIKDTLSAGSQSQSSVQSKSLILVGLDWLNTADSH